MRSPAECLPSAWLCLSLLLGVGSVASTAGAQPALPVAPANVSAAPPPTLRALAPTPASPDVDRRLAYVSGALTRNAPAERAWWFGWIGGFAALAGGQAYFYFTKDEPEERILNAVGGSMSAIGLVGLLVLPNAGRFADHRLAEMPEHTRGERSHKLRAAEQMLEDAEQATWRKRNPIAVVGPMLISAGTSIYVWRKYDATLPALRNLLGSISVNIAHWWTRPTSDAEAARRYRGETARLRLYPQPWLSAEAAGFGVAGSF